MEELKKFVVAFASMFDNVQHIEVVEATDGLDAISKVEAVAQFAESLDVDAAINWAFDCELILGVQEIVQ